MKVGAQISIMIDVMIAIILYQKLTERDTVFVQSKFDLQYFVVVLYNHVLYYNSFEMSGIIIGPPCN